MVDCLSACPVHGKRLKKAALGLHLTCIPQRAWPPSAPQRHPTSPTASLTAALLTAHPSGNRRDQDGGSGQSSGFLISTWKGPRPGRPTDKLWLAVKGNATEQTSNVCCECAARRQEALLLPASPGTKHHCIVNRGSACQAAG